MLTFATSEGSVQKIKQKRNAVASEPLLLSFISIGVIKKDRTVHVNKLDWLVRVDLEGASAQTYLGLTNPVAW